MEGLNFGGGADLSPGTVDLSPPVTADAVPNSLAGSPAPPEAPGAGQGLLGSNRTMVPRNAPTNPLDAAEANITAERDRAQRRAASPMLQLLDPDYAKENAKEATDLNLKLEQVKQARQAQQDMRAKAINMGLDPAQLPATATNDTLVAEGLKRFKQGDLNAYKGLIAAGHKDLVDAYMPDAVSALGGKVEKAQSVITQLDSAPTQAAYNSIRNQLTDKAHPLASLGLDNIPKTLSEWKEKRQGVFTSMQQAKRMVDTYNHQLAAQTDFTPITDEKVAGVISKSFKLGNQEPIPGVTAVIRAGDSSQGGLLTGLRDLREFGKDGKSFATPENVKTVREQLGAEEVKGAIGKYKMAKEFHATASNDKLYTSAAGNALLADELGAIGRDVAEGSKAAGTVGLTKMLESKYGYVEGFLNNTRKELSAMKAWVDGGSKGPEPRMSAQSIQGIKDIANFKLAQTKHELDGRVGQPIETAGRYGIGLDKLGLDNEIQDAVRGIHSKALDETKLKISQYPAIIKGDDRVIFQPGAGAEAAGAKAAPLPLSALPGLTPEVEAVRAIAASSRGAPAAAANMPPVPSGGGGGSPLPGAVYAAGIRAGESGNNYKAGTPGSTSASGAYQFTKSTWNEFKPAGAPDTANEATPAQQDQAFVKFTAANAAALQKADVPATPLTLAMAHQQGAKGAIALAKAPDDALAKDQVGRKEAANNTPFFWDKDGKPLTVAESKAKFAQHYRVATAGPARDLPDVGAAPWTGRRELAGDRIATPEERANSIVARNAPAIGAGAGSFAGPAGALLGGAAGGAVRQAVAGGPGYVDQMTRGAAEAIPAAIPGLGPVAMAVRVATSGAVPAAEKLFDGGSTGDAVESGLAGAAGGAVGELLGRGAGIIGHSVWNRLSNAGQVEMVNAAKVLATQEPRIPDASGKMVVNQEYKKAEDAIKSIHKDPQEVIYNYNASEQGVASANANPKGALPGVALTKGEALAQRPAMVEAAKAGQEMNAVGQEVGKAGGNIPVFKHTPLPDGPTSKIRTPANPGGAIPDTPFWQKLAAHYEIAATAPAANVDAKWAALGEVRTELLKKERVAAASSSDNKEELVKGFRAMADSFRSQQEKMAKALLPADKADALINRLKVADNRYRRAMTASGDGDIVSAIAQGGVKGREAKAAFDALAGNDPAAKRAVDALVRVQNRKLSTELSMMGILVGAETLLRGVPIISGSIGAWKLNQIVNDWMIKRGAGNKASFATLMQREAKSALAARNGAAIGSRIGAGMAQ